MGIKGRTDWEEWKSGSGGKEERIGRRGRVPAVVLESTSVGTRKYHRWYFPWYFHVYKMIADYADCHIYNWIADYADCHIYNRTTDYADCTALICLRSHLRT